MQFKGKLELLDDPETPLILVPKGFSAGVERYFKANGFNPQLERNAITGYDALEFDEDDDRSKLRAIAQSFTFST